MLRKYDLFRAVANGSCQLVVLQNLPKTVCGIPTRALHLAPCSSTPSQSDQVTPSNDYFSPSSSKSPRKWIPKAKSKNVVSQRDDSMFARTSEKEKMHDWIQDLVAYCEPSALLGCLKSLRYIVDKLMSDDIQKEEVKAWENLHIDIAIDATKLLSLIHAKGGTMEEGSRELEDSRQIHKLLRKRCELAPVGQSKSCCEFLLSACEGNFDYDYSIYEWKLQTVGGRFRSATFCFYTLAALAYRQNRLDVLKKLASCEKLTTESFRYQLMQEEEATQLLTLYQIMHLFEKNKVNGIETRMLHPVAKLLALVWWKPFKDDRVVEHCQGLLKHVRERVVEVPIDNVCNSIHVLLDACEGNFNFDLLNSNLLESNTCKHIFGSLAIRQGRLDVLEELSRCMSAGNSLYSEGVLSIFRVMMEALQGNKDGLDKERLLKIFLEHRCKPTLETGPTLYEFENCILPAVRQSSKWIMQPTKVDPVNNECRICHTAIQQKAELTMEEIRQLEEPLRKYLLTPSRNYMLPMVTKSFLKLQEVVAEMKAKGFEGRPLVIDAMNVIYQHELTVEERKLVELRVMKSSVDTIPLEQMLVLLKKLGYGPILAICGQYNMSERDVKRLSALGLCTWLRLTGNVDDLFVINAALMLGPEAHVMTNDAYLDHRNQAINDNATSRLFNRWFENNCVVFWRRPATCWVPGKYPLGVQKDAGGYHIVIKPEWGHTTWTFPEVQCIRCSPSSMDAVKEE